MDIYAPLAGRMGMQWLREELEDHAFRWLNPEGYAAVVDRLKMLHDRNQGLIEEIENALRKKLEEAKVSAVVAFREKKPYAIWSKMERKQISLEQLSDIYAFRIVVDEVIDCYRALAVVHTTWHAVPGRFKDYISSPKQNDYQSIHTTIVGPRHQRAELQIRTERMHSVAEYGVAAHALYKDSANGSGPQNGVLPSHESNAYRWLRHLVDMLLEGDNPEEFLEHTKLELFQDQVFCFTPKGTPDRVAARRQRQSTSPMLCTPTSATPASAARSMAGRCRSSPSSETAMRWRSSLPRCRRPHRLGKALPSLARHARPSGVRRAMRRVPNTASSAAKFSSVPSAGAARSSARR